PAVWVRVSQPTCWPHQYAPPLQQLDNGLIRLEDLLPQVLRKAFGEFSRIPHRAIDFQPVLHTCKVVLPSMTRRSVDTTRAVLGRHVRRQYTQDLSVQEGVLHFEPLQSPARH